MKKKILLFSLAILAGTFHAKAQFSAGLEAGFNKNYANTNAGFHAFTKYEPLEAFNIGIPVKYDFNNWFALQADPQYIRKSYKMLRTRFFNGIYEDRKNSYVQLPIMTHFSFGGTKLKGFLNLGVYGGYWSAGRVKGTQSDVFSSTPDYEDNQEFDNYLQIKPGVNYDEKYQFDKRRDRRIELGWLTGAGVSYQLKPRYQIFAEARYYQGLTDQQKNYMIDQIPRYNETYVIQVGCMYRLGK